MQWEASKNSNLVFYEVCYPPYQDGRFENLAGKFEELTDPASLHRKEY